MAGRSGAAGPGASSGAAELAGRPSADVSNTDRAPDEEEKGATPVAVKSTSETRKGSEAKAIAIIAANV